MSNASLKERISSAISKFENGKLNYTSLIGSIDSTGLAIESIPYEMVVEFRNILLRLAIEQSYEEEDCVSNPKEILFQLKEWLSRVPD